MFSEDGCFRDKTKHVQGVLNNHQRCYLLLLSNKLVCLHQHGIENDVSLVQTHDIKYSL